MKHTVVLSPAEPKDDLGLGTLGNHYVVTAIRRVLADFGSSPAWGSA